MSCSARDSDGRESQAIIQTFIFPCSAFIAGLILDEVNKRLKFLGFPDSVVQFVFAMCCSFMLNKFLPIEITRRIDEAYSWIALDPQTILLLMLPPLIFDSAFRINSHQFFSKIKMLVSLTVFIYLGTLLISSALMMPLLTSTQNLSISAVFLFVSIIVATDPVAVVAMLEEFGAPHRLRLMIEGESLLNDGLALTVYRALLEGFRYETTGHGMHVLPQIFSFFMCFVVSPIIGIYGAYMLANILGKMREIKKKQALILSCVFIMFIFCDTIEGSPALGIMFFGVTLNYNKEIMSPETSQVALELWQSLGYWANNVIFSYAGYLIGKEMFSTSCLKDHSYAEIASNDIFTLIQGVLISPIPLFGRIVSIYLYYRIYPCFRSNRPSKSDFVLLAYSGLRGALGLLLAMELTKEESVGDYGESKVILLLVCSTTVTSLVFQGVSYRIIVAREGTTKRSRYVKETCSRFNKHIEKEFLKKFYAVKRDNYEHHLGTNWAVAESEIFNSLKIDSTKKSESEGENNSWLDSVVADVRKIQQADATDAKIGLYGKLLARAYEYWQQGAVSGNTMHILTAVLEHGIDEGDIAPSNIEDQLSTVDPAWFVKLFSKSIEFMNDWLRRIPCRGCLSFCTMGKHKLFPEARPTERIIKRQIEKWWVFHTTAFCVYTGIVAWSFHVVTLPSISIYLANFWIVWLTCIIEAVYLGHFAYQNRRTRSIYYDFLPILLLVILTTIAFVAVFMMLDGGRCIPMDNGSSTLCLYLCHIFFYCILTSAAFRLLRAVPVAIILLREAYVRKKLLSDRVRLSVLHFFHIILKETQISPDFYDEEAYQTVTREVNRLTSIIESFMRLHFKENSDALSVLPVIKTRQTVRMMSFALKSLLNEMKIEGYFPAEVEDKWTNIVANMREKVDDLLLVPDLTLRENLEVIEWIRRLPEKIRRTVLEYFVKIISNGETKSFKTQEIIETSGNTVLYLKKGICKVSEWLPSRTFTAHERYISQGNFLGERNILMKNRSKKSIMPIMFPKRRYETTTECELVSIDLDELSFLTELDKSISLTLCRTIQVEGFLAEMRHLHALIRSSDRYVSLKMMASSLISKIKIIKCPTTLEVKDEHIAILGCWTELTFISCANCFTKDYYIRGPCEIKVEPADQETEGMVYIERIRYDGSSELLHEFSRISLRHTKGSKKKLVIAKTSTVKSLFPSTSHETTR